MSNARGDSKSSSSRNRFSLFNNQDDCESESLLDELKTMPAYNRREPSASDLIEEQKPLSRSQKKQKIIGHQKALNKSRLVRNAKEFCENHPEIVYVTLGLGILVAEAYFFNSYRQYVKSEMEYYVNDMGRAVNRYNESQCPSEPWYLANFNFAGTTGRLRVNNTQFTTPRDRQIYFGDDLCYYISRSSGNDLLVDFSATCANIMYWYCKAFKWHEKLEKEDPAVDAIMLIIMFMTLFGVTGLYRRYRNSIGNLPVDVKAELENDSELLEIDVKSDNPSEIYGRLTQSLNEILTDEEREKKRQAIIEKLKPFLFTGQLGLRTTIADYLYAKPPQSSDQAGDMIDPEAAGVGLGR